MQILRFLRFSDSDSVTQHRTSEYVSLTKVAAHPYSLQIWERQYKNSIGIDDILYPHYDSLHEESANFFHNRSDKKSLGSAGHVVSFTTIQLAFVV